MQENIFKSAMKSGLILGVLFTLDFILTVIGGTVSGLLGWVVLVATIVVIWKLSCQYRDNECEGIISYGKSLGYILLSVFYASLISAFVSLIYFQLINPDYLLETFSEVMKKLEEMKISVTDEIEIFVQGLLKPVSMAFISIFSNMFFYLIVGLIMSAFVKKEKSIFEQ
jgi:hypothetical protein